MSDKVVHEWTALAYQTGLHNTTYRLLRNSAGPGIYQKKYGDWRGVELQWKDGQRVALDELARLAQRNKELEAVAEAAYHLREMCAHMASFPPTVVLINLNSALNKAGLLK